MSKQIDLEKQTTWAAIQTKIIKKKIVLVCS